MSTIIVQWKPHNSNWFGMHENFEISGFELQKRSIYNCFTQMGVPYCFLTIGPPPLNPQFSSLFFFFFFFFFDP